MQDSTTDQNMPPAQPAEAQDPTPAAEAPDAADEALQPASEQAVQQAAEQAAEVGSEAAPEAAPEAATEHAPEQPAAEAGAEVVAPAAAEAAAPAPAVPELSPQQCSAALAERFPALFALQQPLPLKLRIQADIQARAPGVFTRKTLSIFLHRYTTGTPYLKALVQQTQRFDLDGQPAGEVAAEHREAATAEVARRRAIVEERRAAERQQARKPGPAGAPQADAAAPAEPCDRAARPSRPPRPPRPDRPARAARPDPTQRPQGPRPAAERLARRPEGRREGRPEGRPEARPASRPEPRPPGAALAPVQDTVAASDPAHAARRERALLLRAFEASPLSKANFCVLKGLAPAELDSLLAQARQEAAARPR